MANKTAELIRHCKTESGWKRYPVVFGKNGRIRPNWVNVPGVGPREYPIGSYQIRFYVGRQVKYKKAGTDAAHAWDLCLKEQKILEAKSAAEEAGIQVIQQAERPTLKEMKKKFLQSALDRGALEAEEVYSLALDMFFGRITKTYPDQLTEEDLTSFQGWMRREGYADRTIFNRHQSIVSFLSFCNIDIETVAPKRITPAYEETLPEIYRPEEIWKLMSAANEYQTMMLEVFLNTAFREQEAMHFEFTDINENQKTIGVFSKPLWGFKIKDKQQREVPISDDFLKRLDDYRKKYPKKKLVLGTKTDNPNDKMLRTLKRLARRSGLNCGRCVGCLKPDKDKRECERFYLHKFRATRCTWWLRERIDIRTVQYYMGHSDLASTMRYLRPAEDEDYRKTINATPWWKRSSTGLNRREAVSTE